MSDRVVRQQSKFSLMATKIVISETSPYFLDLDAPTLGATEVEGDGVKPWEWPHFSRPPCGPSHT